MKQAVLRGVVAAGVTLAVAAGGASASMAPSHLAASLMGMGDHGTVNLTVNTHTRRLCWSFTVPKTLRINAAAIHAGMSGTQLLGLGMHYATTGCEAESAMTLEHLAAKPGAYSVWVNTPGHPGELRGRLHAGMAHM